MITDQQVLFPYAYNILGSVEDAKDAVQDVISRHLIAKKEDILDEKSYLIRSVINHAINTKNRNQRISRQSEVWLPEPVATDDVPDRDLDLKDILSYSLLILMEKLNATERAVFILKESFDYSHQEIADVLSISEEHSRKLLSRAKTKLFKPGSVTRSKDQASQASMLLENYITAIRNRDVHQLENILSDEVAYYADGGDKIRVFKKTCTGASSVAEVLILVFHRYQARSSITFSWINHQPAFLYYNKNKLAGCQVFDISRDGSRILQINLVLDPAKLKNLEDGML